MKRTCLPKACIKTSKIQVIKTFMQKRHILSASQVFPACRNIHNHTFTTVTLCVNGLCAGC